MHNKVVDWRPFEYYTLLQTVNSLDYFQTKRLVPTKEGSHLSVYLSKPTPDASEELRAYVQAEYDRGFGNLEPFIRQDIENGRVAVG